MSNISAQRGASMPLMIIFLAMSAVILTIAFKLYPAFYEHWQITSVLETYEKEYDLSTMSIEELERNFEKRLLTNNVRSFNVKEGFFAEITDESAFLSVDYEVRVPMYGNVDAIITFEESFDKKF